MSRTIRSSKNEYDRRARSLYRRLQRSSLAREYGEES